MGTILLREDIILPASLQLEVSLSSKGWNVLHAGQGSVESQVRAAGWNFFFTVNRIAGYALGTLTAETFRKALDRILLRVQELHFNAMEIDKIEVHKVLGLFPYISVSAHARHIQQSEQLENDEQRKTAQTQATWAVG